jgi:replication-associated recombination protein RarA
MSCLPEALEGSTFYRPVQRGFERTLSERIEWLKERKKQQKAAQAARDFPEVADRD